MTRTTLRRSLTATLAAALLVTGCADTDPATDDGAVTGQPADDGADEAVDDTPDDTDDTDEQVAGGEDATAGSTQPAAVTLTLDGRRVPLTGACNGVDGAVLATTQGEVTVTLVREEGTALRYAGEGMTAETDQVEVETVGESTVHRATLQSDQVPTVDVELELGDTSLLGTC